MSKKKPGVSIDVQRAERTGLCTATLREPDRRSRAETFDISVSLRGEPLFLPAVVAIKCEVGLSLEPEFVSKCFCRHICGDWGDLSPRRQEREQIALENGEPVISEFELDTGKLLRIVTSADRHKTTIVLSRPYV